MSTEIEKEANSEAVNWLATLEMAQRLVIESPADFELASELAKGARINWKRLEERRTAITKPILDSKRKVDYLFKPALEALKQIENCLKTKIGTYVTSQKAKQVQAMNATADAYAAGTPLATPIPEVPTAKGISVKTEWDFDIVDPALVPREYCSPDPDKIKQAIWYADTQTPPRPIPGVEFKLRTDTTVRVK